jgi:hypothetical protein
MSDNSDEKKQPCPACGSEDTAGTNLRILPTGFYCARVTGDEEHRRAIIAARPELAPEDAAQNGNGTCGPFSLGNGLSAIGVDAPGDGKAEAESEAALLDALLDARRFDLANPPAKPVPVLLINGKPISTAGNLTNEQALAKAGKTAFEAACIASLMRPAGDCLGVTGQNPDSLSVIHFDTEQSNYDHFEVIKQALARAGLQKEPEWLRSYHLADVPTKRRRKALAHEMKRAAIGGKLCAVFLDGVADLCIDPNDSAEAFGLVEELHGLAITYHCPIICVLHENPGSTEGKTRGHLGSQLERKAETNLRLSKANDGITTVFTERSRHCHIPKESGPRFAWDEAAGMHLSVSSQSEKKLSAKMEELKRVVADVFAAGAKPSFRHKELVEAFMARLSKEERTAKARINDAVTQKFIRHDVGLALYSLGVL